MKQHSLISAVACAFCALSVPVFAQSVTGPPIDVTSGSITEDMAPRLSFDGTKLTYTSTVGGQDYSYTSNNVWVMNSDGTSPTEVLVKAYYGGDDEYSSLSPDGTKVVLHQWNDGGSLTYLWTVDIVNKVATQITTDDSFAAFPTWSSDGQHIVFMSKRNGVNGYQVFMMKPQVEDPTTNPVIQLTNWTDSEANRIRCTPDGKLLLCRSYPSGVLELYGCDLKDSNSDGEADNLHQITSYGQYITDPSQASAGGKIFFIKYAKDGNRHVFSISPDGSALHQVTGGAFDEDFACAASNKLTTEYLDANSNGVGNWDVAVYTLSTATGNGTVSGTLTTSAGAVQAGATVNAYDGENLAGSTTTAANGSYSLSLPPGGYTLQFVTATPDSFTVSRSLVIPAAGTATMNAFTTPTAAPRATNVIATIKSGKVVVRWRAGLTPSAGYNVTGYNVYRATSEVGPWNKIATAPATNPLMYTDNTPGSLASVFYMVTTVTSNGSATVESAYSNVSQAANNLLYNPSFEVVDGSGNPKGWDFGTWGADVTGGTVTDQKVDGARSVAIKTGSASGVGFYNTPFAYMPPNPRVAINEGMWAKFVATTTTWALSLEQAPQPANGDLFIWYPGGGGDSGNGGPWATDGLTASGADTPWTWVANTGNVIEYEYTSATRMSVFWAGDGTATPNVSNAYADDATYQVRRFTDKGMVWGRITDVNGKTFSGCTVTVGGKSVTTTSAPYFVIYDVPTGTQTVKYDIPNHTSVTSTVDVYGGAILPDYATSDALVLVISGTVKSPDGTPCPGADVRLDANDGTRLANVVTDASGHYSMGSVSEDVSFAGNSWITAHKAGYVSTMVTGTNYGTAGLVTVDIELGESPTFVEAAKVTGAAPVIDGVLNTAEWAGAQEVSLRTDPSIASPVKTKCYTKWDADNLYIAFAGEEPDPASMLATSTGHDNGLIWWTGSSWNADDAYGIWVDPNNGARTGLGYEQWQIMTNSNTADPSYADIAWRNAPDMWGLGNDITSFEFKSRVDTVGKMYYTEVKIPFAGLGVAGGMSAPTVAVGTEWIIELARHRHNPMPDGQDSDIGFSILHFVNTVQPLPKGDLNGDRQITTIDIIQSLRIAAGLDSLGARLNQADVNSDTKSNILDTVKIIRSVNGKGTL